MACTERTSPETWGHSAITPIETTELTLYMPVYESSLPARVIGNDGIGLIELRRSGVRTLTPR